MIRMSLIAGLAALLSAQSALAGDVVKIGLVTPITGQFASTGQEMRAGVEQFLRAHGNKVAGKTVELIIKDDGNVADVTKRIATELVVNDHVDFLAGMGLTPLALAASTVATKAQVPLIIMGAGSPGVPKASPYIVRTSWDLTLSGRMLAKWAAEKANVKTGVTLVSDYTPGIDIEKAYTEALTASGGKMLEALRAPVLSPNFAPLLQRAADAKPDAIFMFVPAGAGPIVLREYAERGLFSSKIRLMATGDVLDDQVMDNMGPAVEGLISTYHYSDAHDSALNREFTAGIEKHDGFRANMMAVGAYDGMTLIYKALEATKGDTTGAKLIDAMKGMSWESPRGPVSIDPETRDIRYNVYLRRVEKRPDGRFVNAEIETLSTPAK